MVENEKKAFFLSIDKKGIGSIFLKYEKNEGYKRKRKPFLLIVKNIHYYFLFFFHEFKFLIFLLKQFQMLKNEGHLKNI